MGFEDSSVIRIKFMDLRGRGVMRACSSFFVNSSRVSKEHRSWSSFKFYSEDGGSSKLL
jgi:hypothetical protein